MKTARAFAFAAMIACVCTLSGCSTLDQIIGADDWKDWTPNTTSIQVHADGSLTETIFDTLDQSWYQGNELQDMIARSMNEYNDSHTAGAVNVTSYSDTDGVVKVVIDYRTDDDYAQYNNAEFVSGSMLDAQMKGFRLEGQFLEADGSKLKGDVLDASVPLSHKEYSVVISDGTHVVQVPGEIRYVGEGAQLVNSHVAKVSEDAGGENPAVPLTIIYEKDQEYTSILDTGSESQSQ